MIRAALNRVLPSRAAVPAVSKKRVFYTQPSGVNGDLVPHYQQLGEDLDVKPWALRALAVVESDEKPFSPAGFPIIRFEPGYWKQRRTQTPAAKAFDTAPNALNLDARWTQFLAMAKVDEAAAICSHSWMMWQIMGSHHQLCGAASPQAFRQEAGTIEGQFRLLKYFILESPPLLAALRKQDARAVALHYNGAAFARNSYDIRWAAACKAGGASVWA